MNIQTNLLKLNSIPLSILEPATSKLFMGASKMVNLYLNGVLKILWRVPIEFCITVLQDEKITLAWLGQQSIRLTSVQ